MSDLKTKLFPEDVNWLNQAYGSLEEALIVDDYFSAYFLQREQHGVDTRFYLEAMDVEFFSPEPSSRTSLKLSFSTKTLIILLPDWDYSDAEKQKLRESYLQRFTPILKESQMRTNVFLWKTFSQKERDEIV